MATAKIVYASMTGNTEEIADIFGETLEKHGIEVDIEECVTVSPEDLLDYDICLVGAYTYDFGEIPDEFVDFYEEMAEVDFSGKICASFGSGDTFYDDYCLLVDFIQTRFKEQGGTIAGEGIKVDLDPDTDDIAAIETLCEAIVDQVNA